MKSVIQEFKLVLLNEGIILLFSEDVYRAMASIQYHMD